MPFLMVIICLSRTSPTLCLKMGQSKDVGKEAQHQGVMWGVGVAGANLDTTVKSSLGGHQVCFQRPLLEHLTFAVLLNSKQSCSSSLSFFDAITGLGTSKTHYFLPTIKGPRLGAPHGGSEGRRLPKRALAVNLLQIPDKKNNEPGKSTRLFNKAMERLAP